MNEKINRKQPVKSHAPLNSSGVLKNRCTDKIHFPLKKKKKENFIFCLSNMYNVPIDH